MKLRPTSISDAKTGEKGEYGNKKSTEQTQFYFRAATPQMTAIKTDKFTTKGDHKAKGKANTFASLSPSVRQIFAYETTRRWEKALPVASRVSSRLIAGRARESRAWLMAADVAAV